MQNVNISRRAIIAALLYAPLSAKSQSLKGTQTIQLDRDFTLEICHGGKKIRLTADEIMTGLEPFVLGSPEPGSRPSQHIPGINLFPL